MHALVERLDAERAVRLFQLLQAYLCLGAFERKRLLGAGEVVGAHVMGAGARDLEMGGIPRRAQHGSHVAADGHRLPLDETHLVGQVEVALVLGHGAQVGGHLPVVFLAVFQVALDGAHRMRREADAPQLRGYLEVADMQLGRLHVVERVDAVLGQDAAEVFQVESPRKAFASQYGVVVELGRHAPVGEDVGEVQLAARFEHARDFGEHLVLEGGQVDDAVRDDHVHRIVLDADGGQILDEALMELDVGLGEPEALHLPRLVAPREGKLLLGHVHADHAPGGPHQFRAEVHVPSRAAS